MFKRGATPHLPYGLVCFLQANGHRCTRGHKAAKPRSGRGQKNFQASMFLAHGFVRSGTTVCTIAVLKHLHRGVAPGSLTCTLTISLPCRAAGASGGQSAHWPRDAAGRKGAV